MDDLSKLFNKDKEAMTAHETIQKYGETSSPFEVQKDGQSWEGREVAVKGEPLMDSGEGKKLYIRNFEFSKNPTYKDRELSNQELFNLHLREMERSLWGDGLVPYKEESPRITRRSKGRYVITVIAEPRFGISAFDDAYTLQDFLPAKSLPKKK